MTETSPVTHMVPMLRGLARRGSVGPPVPGTECRIVDPASGDDVAGGQPGELWVRGSQVMRGYLNNDETSAAMLGGSGWLRTGDIAIADKDGWLTVADRVKELIKCKGLQVAPAELESFLMSHPDVAECGVVGIPDEQARELPMAFIVPAVSAPDTQALISFVASQVAPYKRIRMISWWRKYRGHLREKSSGGYSALRSTQPWTPDLANLISMTESRQGSILKAVIGVGYDCRRGCPEAGVSCVPQLFVPNLGSEHGKHEGRSGR